MPGAARGTMGTRPEGAKRAAPPDGGGRSVHDVLVAVPFRHRLSTKLLGMSALLVLAALAALAFAERRMQRDLVDQLEASTALLADAVQTTWHEAILQGGPEHAWATVGALGGLERIERIRVLDKRGRVVFSTGRDVGALVARSGRACAACHAGRATPLSKAPAEARTEVVRSARGRVLAMTAPIYNARGCSTAACHVHPPGRQVLGLLELNLSLDELDAHVLAFRYGFVAMLFAAVLVLAVLLYLFGRAEIVEPVAALVEGTRRVARDELDVEIRVHSRGELGLLATSFNDMTKSLRILEDDLTGVLAGLESQVEARTAELKAAQETLFRAEKLSSLGKLSASIAHEINNPLAGILTFAKLVSRTLAEGPPDEPERAAMQRNLALVEREAQRCSAIVKNLLEFARERPIQPKPVDLRLAVEEALFLLANQAQTQGITLEKDLRPVPDVLADLGQLRQAFLNIAINACEAMGPSGTLRVTTRAHAGMVEIAFADTGPGIPPDRLLRIFDPFFTTKEKGTGLGLSVVYGIVERHGGTVDARSELGKGTTFLIHLPVATARAEPAAEPSVAAAG